MQDSEEVTLSRYAKSEIILDFIADYVLMIFERNINNYYNGIIPLVETSIDKKEKKLLTKIIYPTKKDVRFGKGKIWKRDLYYVHRSFAYMLGTKLNYIKIGYRDKNNFFVYSDDL